MWVYVRQWGSEQSATTTQQRFHRQCVTRRMRNQIYRIVHILQHIVLWHIGMSSSAVVCVCVSCVVLLRNRMLSGDYATFSRPSNRPTQTHIHEQRTHTYISLNSCIWTISFISSAHTRTTSYATHIHTHKQYFSWNETTMCMTVNHVTRNANGIERDHHTAESIKIRIVL